MSEPVYVIDAIRTAVGKHGGALSGVRPDDLLATVIRALIDRNPELDTSVIEDVIAGDANQAGEDTRNVARMAVLLAGLPVSVPGNTVNRLCASGLQAIMDVSRAIRCEEGLVYIAGGVESMSRAPFVLARESVQEGIPVDTTIGWRFTNPALTKNYPPLSMGETAEKVAGLFNVSRIAQDEYALHSHEKYFVAKDKLAEEIVGVEVTDPKKGHSFFNVDEYPRKTSMQLLTALKPAFAVDGTVTAGNSSGLNDGAAAILLAGKKGVERFGFRPMGKVISMAVSGIDPSVMGMGPVEATRKALARAGLHMADIGLVELNESFASQAIACIQELDLNPAIVNVNGGSIAIGHPLGCSGVRISTTLLYEMRRRNVRYGLATMCAGMGQGAAVIYERDEN